MNDNKKFKRKSDLRFNPFEVGKMPPQVPEMEEAVLGAIMLEKGALKEVYDLIVADDFYIDAHSRIYNAIDTLYTNKKAIDILTVVNQLKSTDELEIDGCAYYVSKLTNRVASSANIKYHADEVIKKAMLRRIILSSTQTIQACFESDAEPSDLLDAQKSMLSNIERYNGGSIDATNRMKETMDSVYKAKENGGISGVPSGFSKLDSFLGGLAGGDYIVIGARSGSFKSAVVLTMQHKLSEMNIATLMFQMEMTNAQIGVREISIKSGVPIQNIKRAKLSEAEWIDVHKAVGKVSESSVKIDTEPRLKIRTIKSRIQKAIDDFGVKVIVVDYLNLCDLEQNKHGNREQAVAAHSAEMKSIAKELDVSIIELVQFNKEAGRDEMKSELTPPNMTFIKDSGAIEFCADAVILLWYPSKIDENFVYQGIETRGKLGFVVAKNKNGMTGTFWVGLKAETNQFFELDENNNYPNYEPNKHIEPNFEFENDEKPNILTK